MIELNNVDIVSKDGTKTYLSKLSWTMKAGESWLITGANGSGKAELVRALSGNAKFSGEYKNVFNDSVAVVSLEEAAKLIEEERNRDESEYINKLDIGRTGRAYICEVLGGSDKKNAPLPEIAKRLETLPEVKICGVEHILDRGLHLMSTGEIRRTLLCRALLSGKKLLVLSDPFAGLDAESRRILLEFFDSITKKQLSASEQDMTFPRIILCMERFHEIPSNITKVLEFKKNQVSYCGNRDEFEKLVENRRKEKATKMEEEKRIFFEEIKKIREESKYICPPQGEDESLVRFEDVNVSYGYGEEEHKVLVNMNWEVKKGEHWLIRGPNGSGKTTILELITGDNMQVFREKVFIFGKRRGSGESIWDIKKKLGIVSYRLHVEYRMVGGTTLENVIVSGFKDSIGMYEIPTDFELKVARAWLKLAGFEGREKESFSSISYGEQRAILILRAAVKEPKLLILDEPCHGLDEDYRDKILNLLELIAATGTTTMLHVTHDPSEVQDFEKNILELKQN